LKHSIQRGVLPATFDISLDSSLLASQGQPRGRPIHEVSPDTPEPESKPAEPAVEPSQVVVETPPVAAEPPKPPETPKPPRRKRTPAKERVMQVRLYSDPTASWGYCAAKEALIYGYRCSAIVARVKRRDLPVRVSISTCSTPEVEMGMKDIVGFHRYLRDEKLPVKLKHLMADKGYDALALHKLCDDLKMLPIIPIRASTKKRLPEGFTVNEEGVPICPAGKKMRRHAFNKRQNKMTYNCPVKRPTHKNGKPVWKQHCSECPMAKLCEEKSKMGPIVHIRGEPEKNLRVCPKVERESETFKEQYKDRTSTERYFSRVQGIARRPYRREHIMGMMAVSLAIKAHLQVWLSLPP
jgi:Transposase DDE domain